MKTGMIFLLIFALSVLKTAAQTEVKEVSLSHAGQKQPAYISYTLEGEDAIITVDFQTNGIPLTSVETFDLNGDVFKKITPGSCTIVWDVNKLWPDTIISNVTVSITAWSLENPPPYLLVDLRAGSSASAGEYPVNYFPTESSLPFGELTNDIYKTDFLLLKYIHADTFYMGSLHFEPYRVATSEYLHRVTLTNNFYVGVYEVTQKQWELVMGDTPSGFTMDGATRPVENISYLQIRKGTDPTTINWPTTGYQVGVDSFMGKLRSRSKLKYFDLPTEAQWEFACRAGTWQSINVFGGVPITNTLTDANMDLAGRYTGNGGPSQYSATNKHTIPTTYATAKVGSYLPNSWGLYDMHGNVFEWTLDWFEYNLGVEAVVEPVGVTNGTHRAIRGGSFHNDAQHMRTAWRSSGRVPENETRWHTGLRVVLLH